MINFEPITAKNIAIKITDLKIMINSIKDEKTICFFEKPAGYGLSYERLLDLGLSNDVSQFSFKISFKKISDTQREPSYIYRDVLIYNEEAKQFSGYEIKPEFKWYFGWGAPFGTYFSLAGNYESYEEVYRDLINNANNYTSSFSVFGGGFGLGHQIVFGELISIDLGIQYIVENISVDLQTQTRSYFDDYKNDGVGSYVNLGLIF